MAITIKSRKSGNEVNSSELRDTGFQSGDGGIVEPLSPITKTIRTLKPPEDTRDGLTKLLDSLDDEAMRSTALMKMQGFSLEEISKALGCTLEESKYRLEQIRSRWRLFFRGND